MRQVPLGVDELSALLLQLKGSNKTGVKERLLTSFSEPTHICIEESQLRRRHPIVNPRPLPIIESVGSMEDDATHVIKGCEHAGDVAGSRLPGKPLLRGSRRAAVEVDDRQAFVT